VVVSDHTGWYSEESVKDLRRKASEEIARVFAGEIPRNWINPWEVESTYPDGRKQESLT
jgi:D-3-phosphoglycerate dehydrogenase